MFYVSSASARINNTTARLSITLPDGCGAYETMTNHHCPLTGSGKDSSNKRNNTTNLIFDCIGGDNNRSVTSIMTQYCGRYTMTTFSTRVKDRNYVDHFADVSHGAHQRRNPGEPRRTHTYDQAAYIYITLLNNIKDSSRTVHNTKWCKSHSGSGC